MCVCVCVYVCVCSQAYLSNHTSELYQIFCTCCLSPWLGSAPAGWRNLKGKGIFWAVSFHWQCIVQHSIWYPYENGWTDRHAVLDKDSVGLQREAAIFGVVRAFKSIGNLRCTGRCSVTARAIIQSPITACSRRDYSVCHASANSILKNAVYYRLYI